MGVIFLSIYFIVFLNRSTIKTDTTMALIASDGGNPAFGVVG